MRRIWTTESLISALRNIYGDNYDYSDVVYAGVKKKVHLRCKKHNVEFDKSIDSLLKHHVGCPICWNENKATNYANRVVKTKQTVQSKYGADNVMKVDAIRQSMVNTVRDRYGVDNIMKLDSTVKKVQSTNLERYGATSYVGSDIGREIIENTNLKRYGAKNFMQSDARFDVLDDMKEKSKQTQLERYGSEHFSQSDVAKEHLSERKQKEYETKKQSGTFNTSSIEDVVYDELIQHFGIHDVLRQYMSEKYPFACDFYVKSLDLYIELNVHWTHGGRPFDADSEDCLKIEHDWLLKSRNSDFYKNALVTWVERDVLKRQTAKQNDLNYITFWDKDLKDFELWISLDCPVGHDYNSVCTWLEG